MKNLRNTFLRTFGMHMWFSYMNIFIYSREINYIFLPLTWQIEILSICQEKVVIFFFFFYKKNESHQSVNKGVVRKTKIIFLPTLNFSHHTNPPFCHTCCKPLNPQHCLLWIQKRERGNQYEKKEIKTFVCTPPTHGRIKSVLQEKPNLEYF